MPSAAARDALETIMALRKPNLKLSR